MTIGGVMTKVHGTIWFVPGPKTTATQGMQGGKIQGEGWWGNPIKIPWSRIKKTQFGAYHYMDGNRTGNHTGLSH